MPDLSVLMIPWAVGFLAGYLACIPVGPVNVTIINEGARRGFRHVLFIGLGAVLMEAIYSMVAFAGFARLFTSTWVRAVMELVSFVVVSVIGVKYLLTREMPATPHAVVVVEQRLHPHTAFMTGFVRVLGNPVTLLFWVAFAAACVAHEWVDTTWASKGAAVGGIAMGSFAWFAKLGYAVSLGHRRFSPRVLLRTAHISGAILIAAGLFMGGRLVTALARHHQLQKPKETRAPILDRAHPGVVGEEAANRRDELRESSIQRSTPLRPRGTRPSEATLREVRTLPTNPGRTILDRAPAKKVLAAQRTRLGSSSP